MRRLLIALGLYRNSYLMDHPAIYCWSVGLALAGVLYMIQGGAALELSPLARLPHFVQVIFGAQLVIGGWTFARGLRIRNARYESLGAGINAWACLLFAALVAPLSAPLTIVLVWGAIGFGLRSGVVLERARDQVGVRRGDD